MRGIVLALGLILVPALVSGADEATYTIKLKVFPDQKESVSCHSTEKQTGNVRFLNPAGKVVEVNKIDANSEEIYTLTVMEAGKRAPKRFRQGYSKAVSSLVKGGVRSYQGVTVEFLLQEDGYRLGLPEKHNVTEKDQENLLLGANNDLEVPFDEVFIPGKPVKVDETWKVDPKLLRKAFAGYGVIDADKTEGTGRLVRVYDRDGVLFGVIAVKLTIAFSVMDRLKYDPPAVFEINSELDTDITGTKNIGVMTLNSKLEGTTSVKSGKVNLTMEIKRQDSVKKERSAVK